MNGGLYCASQASSPVVIRLGAHTGGSVCLGLQPLHVVAADPLNSSAATRTSGSAFVDKMGFGDEDRDLLYSYLQRVSHVVEGKIGEACSWCVC